MKFLKIFFVLIVFFTYQQKSYSEIEIDATYVILQDHLSGEILYEKESDEKIYPASSYEVLGDYFLFQNIHIKKPTTNNKKPATSQYPRPPVSLVWFNSW